MQAGYIDVFDARLDAVSDFLTCEKICFAWQKGTCRSFTYDSKERRCYLSHTSPKIFGWNPMENMNSDYSFGEVDNCMKCKLFDSRMLS